VQALNRDAELNQTAVQLRRENTVNQLATQWSATLQDLENAIRRYQLYQEQTELATQSLNILMKAYSTEGTGLEDLWDIRLQLLDYELESYSAITDRLISVAKLEMLAALDIEN
jgi:outer membrane protein TolC